MNLIECFQKNSYWYKNNPMGKKVVGVLWHDTAGGNTYIKRYVQPFETDKNYNEMIKLLGKNQYGNDWNHNGHKSGVNAWIGRLADGSIATVQAGEWERHPSGCGRGNKGSLNGYTKSDKDGEMYYTDELWVQFEICDDGYKDKGYFDAVYKEACELTAYLCDMYDIDPMGTVKYGGVKVPTILCHKDSYNLGFGCDHGDVYGWFNKFGKTMDDVRKDVQNIIKGYSVYYPDTKPELEPKPAEIKKGDLVKIVGKTYYGGGNIPSRILSKNWYVHAISGDRAVINKSEDGLDEIMSPVNTKDLALVKEYVETPVQETPKQEAPKQETPKQEEPKLEEKQEVSAPVENKQEAPKTEEKAEQNNDPAPEDNQIEETSTAFDLEDIPENNIYIHNEEEAKSFLIKLLNVIIDFITKLFGKNKEE